MNKEIAAIFIIAFYLVVVLMWFENRQHKNITGKNCVPLMYLGGFVFTLDTILLVMMLTYDSIWK